MILIFPFLFPQRQEEYTAMPLYSQVSSSMRRRPYNLEAKMRMKAYRRQAMLLQRQKEMDEELRTFELNPDDCYKKGDPDTVDGIVSDITSIGVIVDLPNGRQGLLPASQLGCMGGEDLLKIGQELTVKVIQVPQPHGKDRLFLKRVTWSL